MSIIKVSERFNTRNHGIVTVLDYIDCRNILAKFENSGTIKTVRANHLQFCVFSVDYYWRYK